MKKKPLSIALALLALAALMFVLSGCSGSKLSGTFVNPDDSLLYLVFNGNTVALYEGGVQTRNGTFTESAKTASGYLLRITYDGASVDERYWLDEKKETIFESITGEGNTAAVGEVAFIKEN
jgi:hypothetical protein